MTARARTPSTASTDAAPVRNEVLLTGRVPAAALERTLPSGDVIAVLRVVVARRVQSGRRRQSPPRGEHGHGSEAADGQAPARRPPVVDTIDVVCWSASTRRVAARLTTGDVVDVEGALRRRFFGAAGGRQSRYEVEARHIRRVARAPGPATYTLAT